MQPFAGFDATNLAKSLPMDDLELARRLAENDDDALAELVERHYAPTYRFLRRLSADDEAARDLAQETLLQVRNAASGFRGRSAFRTWMLRIAYRTYARSRRRRRHETLSEALASPSSEASSLDRVAFEQALLTLSPKLRDALLLFEVLELSMEETATVLRVPSGTAKARVARARQAMQNHLEQTQEFRYVEPAIET